MFKVFIVLVTLAGAIESRAWVRVGNGGEGVRFDGAVYMRDLYEVEAHIDPYVEDSISSGILEQWSRFPQRVLFRKQETVLLKKLTELDRIHPGIAEILVAGLERYRFIFVDKDLPLMPDESHTIPQDLRVSIALRQYSDIVIQRQLWNSLSVASQVALLIHEIFYALSQVTCPEADRCFQYSQAIRPLVGNLFKQVKPNNFREGLVRELSLSQVQRYCDTKPLRVEFNIIGAATAGRGSLAYFAEEFSPSDSGFTELASAACQSLGAEAGAENLIYSFNHEYLSLGQKVYATKLQVEGGQMDSQLALTFRRLNRVVKRSVRKTSVNDCVNRLATQFRDFLAVIRKDELSYERVCIK